MMTKRLRIYHVRPAAGVGDSPCLVGIWRLESLSFSNFGRNDRLQLHPSPPTPSRLPYHFTMSADSSPLSSPPSSPGEMPEFFDRSPSPLSSPSDPSPEPPSNMQSKSKKREPEPPHEEVLADNPDIAVSSDASITSWNTRLRLSSPAFAFSSWLR